MNRDARTPYADPEGAAHGWAAFFDRAMDGESKNPGTNESPDLLRRGGHFFWLLFLTRIFDARPSGRLRRSRCARGPAKKSDPLAGRRVEAFDLACLKAKDKIKRFRPLRGRVHFFWWTPKETEPKKNDSSTQQPQCSLVPAFSDSPSWLGRRTAGIHARRPSGVRCAWMRHGNQKRLDYRRAHTDAENRYPDPRTVCTIPSSPLGSSVLRNRRMCTSTVRSST